MGTESPAQPSTPHVPNYLALSGGSTFGITSDCAPTDCPITAANLAGELEAAVLGWRAYAEGIGTPCNLAYQGLYAPKHEPYVYYTDIQTTARCAAHVVDYSSFASDLTAGGEPFMTLTPNLCDDMHNSCSSDQVVTLVISPLGKPAYRSGVSYDHYSLLATIEDAFGVARLGSSAGATPMADFFE